MFRRFRRSPQPQLQAETAVAAAATEHTSAADAPAAAATKPDALDADQRKTVLQSVTNNNNNNSNDGGAARPRAGEAVQPHMPPINESDAASQPDEEQDDDDEEEEHILHAVDHTCKPPLLRPQNSRSTSRLVHLQSPAAAGRALPSSLPYSSDWSLITSPADLSPPAGATAATNTQQAQQTVRHGPPVPQLFVTVGPGVNAETPGQMEEWATMTPTLPCCRVSPPPQPNAMSGAAAAAADEMQNSNNNEEGQESAAAAEGRGQRQAEGNNTADAVASSTTATPPTGQVKRRLGMAAAALLPRSPALSSPMTSLFVRLLPVSSSMEASSTTNNNNINVINMAAASTLTPRTPQPAANAADSAAAATIVRMPALSEGSVSMETAAQSLEEPSLIAPHPTSSPSPSPSVLHASESCEPAAQAEDTSFPSHETNWDSPCKSRPLHTRAMSGGAGVVSDCVLWLWQAVREDVLYHWYPQLLLVLGNRQVRYEGQGRTRRSRRGAGSTAAGEDAPRWERRHHKRRRSASQETCETNSSEEDIQMSWHWSLSSDTVATAVHSFLIFLL